MRNLTFNRKILLIFIFSIGFSVLFSFLFIHYLYSKLYVSSIEESIIHQGKRTASHYHYGELSEEIIKKSNGIMLFPNLKLSLLIIWMIYPLISLIK